MTAKRANQEKKFKKIAYYCHYIINEYRGKEKQH